LTEPTGFDRPLWRRAASARSPEHGQGGLAARFLVNRAFSRLWFGQAISSVGDFVFDTTLTLWIATVLLAGSRWAPEAVSGLMLCAFAFAVAVLVGPLSGVFVDRWSKRRTMLASEAVRAIQLLAVTPNAGVVACLTLPPSRRPEQAPGTVR
jgi:MFS family permease